MMKVISHSKIHMMDLDYKNDIKLINGIRNTDLIDIRPRVSSYTVAESDEITTRIFR